MASPWEDFESSDTTTATAPSDEQGPWTQFEPEKAAPVQPPFFPSDATIKSPQPPLLPAMGERSTTYGGPPKAVASAAETLVEPTEAWMNPRVTTPKLTVNKDDHPAVAIGKEAVNIASSIPEFLSSNMGLASLVSGAAAPTATAGAFTVDMLKNAGEQIASTYKNWDQMTGAQKAAAITDIGGNALMALLTGKHATTGVLNKSVPARAVADILNRSEFTPEPKPGTALVQPGQPSPAPAMVTADDLATDKAPEVTPSVEGPVAPPKAEAPAPAPPVSVAVPPVVEAKAVEAPDSKLLDVLKIKFDGTQPGAATKIPTAEQLSAMPENERAMYANILAQQGEQWALTPQPGSEIPGRTFYVKKGATPDEIQTAYQAKVAQEKAANPAAAPPAPTAEPVAETAPTPAVAPAPADVVTAAAPAAEEPVAASQQGGGAANLGEVASGANEDIMGVRQVTREKQAAVGQPVVAEPNQGVNLEDSLADGRNRLAQDPTAADRAASDLESGRVSA